MTHVTCHYVKWSVANSSDGLSVCDVCSIYNDISYHLQFSWPVFVTVIMRAVNWTGSCRLTWANYQINSGFHVICVNLVQSECFLLFTCLHSLMGWHFTCQPSRLAVLSFRAESLVWIFFSQCKRQTDVCICYISICGVHSSSVSVLRWKPSVVSSEHSIEQ